MPTHMVVDDHSISSVTVTEVVDTRGIALARTVEI